jgi:hypothetical protein
MTGPIFQIGEYVVFKKTPPHVFVGGNETKHIFQLCVGRIMRIEDITDQGLLALARGPDIHDEVGGFMNSIYVEPEFVSPPPTEDNR